MKNAAPTAVTRPTPCRSVSQPTGGVTTKLTSMQALPTRSESVASRFLFSRAESVQNGGTYHIVAIATVAPKPTNNACGCSTRSSMTALRWTPLPAEPCFSTGSLAASPLLFSSTGVPAPGSSPSSEPGSSFARLRRPHMARMPGGSERRKGTRQPQTSICSLLKTPFKKAMSALEKAQATWLPTEMKQTAMPSVCMGEASIRYAETAPISPPADSPWMARRRIKATRPKP
mmetsp:Transcript_112475/g.328798  ORF Transcript_112475/g.328798 Transcript_112475/m.328798 type:complete len:231 (-) Transcript_112475:464-1156(-)